MKAANMWMEENQQYLSAGLDEVRCKLEQYIHSSNSSADIVNHMSSIQLQKADNFCSSPPSLDLLCATFGLSPFERDILLICAGVELDSSFLKLCADAQGDASKTYPTFSLALAALPDGHWSALSPTAPLRYWQLVDVEEGRALTLSPVRIDERVLHYLVGVNHLDERLTGIMQSLTASGDLVPSHRDLVERIIGIWSNAALSCPIVQLCGEETASMHEIAAAACMSLGLNPYVLYTHFIPTHPLELETLIRLLEREYALNECVILLDCVDLNRTDAIREKAIERLVQRLNGPIVMMSDQRMHMKDRSMITMDVEKPTANEQLVIWEHALGADASSQDREMEALVSHFNLSSQTIYSTCTEVLQEISSKNKNPDSTVEVIWNACRMQVRPRLDDLAQRIEPAATWEDLVLPAQQLQILQDIALHVRQRARVYNTWGFAARSSQGLGISAVFAGISGTGKTMAAEVIASELKLDLYRIDLSQVVSKYIGETEKNLRKVFDAAEEGGAILLFDEADALFGKRSEVKDSHDRYANIEVSYLLQRMEAYRGLAILTTNMKDALDTAFLRRIRFIVQFPFPDASQRIEIWRRIFPAETPTDGLDMNKLAKLNVAGGNIKNIALYAAFLAADAGEPVKMRHLLKAARAEYVKLERRLTDAEIGGWI